MSLTLFSVIIASKFWQSRAHILHKESAIILAVMHIQRPAPGVSAVVMEGSRTQHWWCALLKAHVFVNTGWLRCGGHVRGLSFIIIPPQGLCVIPELHSPLGRLESSKDSLPISEAVGTWMPWPQDAAHRVPRLPDAAGVTPWLLLPWIPPSVHSLTNRTFIASLRISLLSSRWVIMKPTLSSAANRSSSLRSVLWPRSAIQK